MKTHFENSINLGIIDLTTEKVTTKKYSFNTPIFRKYLGAEGIALEYLLRNMPPHIDPLGPENYLCVITGILSGTNTPFSGRYIVAGKSPLTDTWGEANSGGRFGPELRKTGFDILLITGIAKQLSILHITNDSIEIKPAKYLEGKDCSETEEILKQKFNSKVQIASIGLAGENRVLVSGIVTDKGRIAARSGLGAVMGSKCLKAIVARGTKKVPIYDFYGFNDLRVLVTKKIKKGPIFLMKTSGSTSVTLAPWLRRFRVSYGSIAPNIVVIDTYKRWGTCSGTAVCVETGDSTVKNFKGSHKDYPLSRSAKITSDNVTKYKIKKYGCISCPIACGGIMAYKDDLYDFPETQKPEYETLAMLGPNLLNDDIGSIYAMNDYCNRQGLDTIAIGSILGFLIEAMEKGIISRDEADGFELKWNNPINFLKIIEKITKREGVGDTLAMGVGKAAQEFGIEAEKIAMHIRNQGIPAHDPRFSKSMLIPYKLDPSPGRHTPFSDFMVDQSKFKSMYKSSRKATRRAEYYCYQQTYSTLGLCQFGMLTGKFPALEFTKLVTGIHLTMDEFIRIGERLFTLKHLFNLREGINPLETEIPIRVLEKAETGPHNKISLIKEEKLIIENFLTALRWDTTTSEPDVERLKQLELEKFI
ncbi:MAG: aldehyde ferredoxin oxidoreductase family protein [Candidatus Hodarchaeota archaeon]